MAAHSSLNLPCPGFCAFATLFLLSVTRSSHISIWRMPTPPLGSCWHHLLYEAFSDFSRQRCSILYDPSDFALSKIVELISLYTAHHGNMCPFSPLPFKTVQPEGKNWVLFNLKPAVPGIGFTHGRELMGMNWPIKWMKDPFLQRVFVIRYDIFLQNLWFSGQRVTFPPHSLQTALQEFDFPECFLHFPFDCIPIVSCLFTPHNPFLLPRLIVAGYFHFIPACQTVLTWTDIPSSDRPCGQQVWFGAVSWNCGRDQIMGFGFYHLFPGWSYYSTLLNFGFLTCNMRSPVPSSIGCCEDSTNHKCVKL